MSGSKAQSLRIGHIVLWARQSWIKKMHVCSPVQKACSIKLFRNVLQGCCVCDYASLVEVWREKRVRRGKALAEKLEVGGRSG